MREDRKGYPWIFLDIHRPWVIALIGTTLLIILGVISFEYYAHTSLYLSPASNMGYGYATIALVCIILASILHTVTRRSRSRAIVGRLHSSLQWHISLGILALFFALLHAAGNYDPDTGTYALYGLIGLVASGIIGRLLDRILPRLIARNASAALTENGEDKSISISRNIQALIRHNTQQVRSQQSSNQPGTKFGNALPNSWDLAYISLAETPQEVKRDNVQYRFVPDRKSPLNNTIALIPGIKENMEELKIVQKAMQREQFYASIIRYWRALHVILVIVSSALLLWHLEYVAQLLAPTLFHH